MSDASEHATLPSGAVFGRYTITRVIGTGGMGAVYEAQHNDLKKRVAIKTLHSAFADHGEIQARFMREGESASRIRHPHVVDVTDFGVHEGVPFLVMEYLEGESLGDLIEREGPMSPAAMADIMLPVCAGIGAAHDEGVIHRDLKPDNLFLARGRKGNSELTPKVVDFGISKVEDSQQPSSLTSTGSMLGTPFYMSPEQLRTAKNIDHRIDQYALGVIMYECITGERPFMAETLYEMMHKIATGDFAPPRAINAAIPENFERVVLRAMSRTPEERYPSVRALAAALLPFASPKQSARWEEEFRGSEDMYEAMASRSGPVSPLGATVQAPVHHAPQPPQQQRGGLGGKSNFLTASQLFEDPSPPTPSPNMTGAYAAPGSGPMNATGVMQSVGAGTMANTGREIESPFVAPPAAPRSSLALYGIAAGLLIAILGAGVFVGLRSSNAGGAGVTASATAASAHPPFTAELATVPPTAIIEIDGQNVGAGAYAHSFPHDGTTHSVRVSAPGYVPRAFTFRDTPPDRVVQLEPLPGGAGVVAVPSGMMMIPTAVPSVVMAPTAQGGSHHAGGGNNTNTGPRPRATAAPAAPSAAATATHQQSAGTNGAAILQ